MDRAVAEFRRGTRELQSAIAQVLVGSERAQFDVIRKQHLAAGAPAELAARVASLDAHNATLDIVELAAAHRVRVVEAAAHVFRGRRAHRT